MLETSVRGSFSHSEDQNSSGPAGRMMQLSDCIQNSIDRKLGYFGRDRFVYFYYEPRGQEVMWNDGQSYGFGLGAWQTFIEEVQPIGRRYGIDLGNAEGSSRHVLLIDRGQRQAYLADRSSAQAVVVGQHTALSA